MCQSNISLKKFLKLFLEIEFYRIVIYSIFLLTGYIDFSFMELIKVVFPVYGVGTGFTSSYLVFFLFIPYLNLVISVMNERQHLKLIGLCLLVGTALQTFMNAPQAFTYVGWFMVLYFIASYIRLYAKDFFDKEKVWGYAALFSVLVSWCSMLAGAWVFKKTNKAIYYYFVSDSNKILAVITAICVFLFFKNLKMKYHPLINKVAASTFGVLLIHASSDTMRQWLWKDTFQNVKAFHSDFLIIHAFLSVVTIYIVCTLIDMLRIKFVEDTFFSWYDKFTEKNIK